MKAVFDMILQEKLDFHSVDTHVGKRFREKRILCGLSQAELAKELGVTFQQIQKYEKGSNRLSASRLYGASRIFEEPVSYFFAGLPGQKGFQESNLDRAILLNNASKKEILDYLKRQKASFRADATNQSVRYLRNRIRLKLIPWLEKEINPQVQKALARVPESLQEESQVLEQMEKTAWQRVFLKKKGRMMVLSRKRFENYPAPLQFRILERGLKKLDAKSGLGFEAWQRLRPFLKLTATRQSLPKDIDISLTSSKLTLCKRIWSSPSARH